MKILSPLLAILSATPALPGDKGAAVLDISDGDRVVISYQSAYLPSPDPAAPWYGRSGFIHPIHTPSGRVVSDAFPADHLHQHGVMMAWTSARIGDRKVDFWNSRKQEGRVEHIETVSADAGRIVVKLRHIDATTEPPTPVLEETWEITRMPHPTMNVFDLLSTQTCVMDEPLDIEQYHYGGLCVRGSAAWGKQTGFVTSEGKGRGDGNHSRAKWVAMSDQVDGAPCGLACLGHPQNFRAPQPVRLHPEMPYFSFAPMVAGAFKIRPGEPFVSRYRFVAFDGKADPAGLDKLWQDFAGGR